MPFWPGILNAVGATALGLAAMFVGLIIAMFAAVLITGAVPSITPGHPLMAVSEAIFYVVCGSFAWRFFRRTGHTVFKPLQPHDIRVIAIAVAALILIRIGVMVQLIATHQTKHVQAGFEHYNVITKQPTVTALTIALAVTTLVVIAPIVEELVFRGLLFGSLAPRIGTLASAITTALLFGIAHGDPILFPSLAALGLVSALAYAATNNLTVPITLHAASNALGAFVLITSSLNPH